MTNPGINSKPFFIELDGNELIPTRYTILELPNGVEVRVVKIYPFNLWRRILHFFHLPFKMFNCIKVKEIK